MYLTCKLQLNWAQWMIGVAWTRVADMPGCYTRRSGEMVWWENDVVVIRMLAGPVALAFGISGPRRNVRVEMSRAMIERN